MKRILKSMVFIFAALLSFSSCAKNEAPYTESQKQEYTAVGSLFCEYSQSENEADSEETNLNTVMIKKEYATYKEILSSNAFSMI